MGLAARPDACVPVRDGSVVWAWVVWELVGCDVVVVVVVVAEESAVGSLVALPTRGRFDGRGSDRPVGAAIVVRTVAG